MSNLCPVNQAINEIKGGREWPKETPGVVIGGREITAGHSKSRAMAAKLELARAKVDGTPYNGELLRFGGQDYQMALCYLLDSKYSPLCEQMRLIMAKFDDAAIIPELCMIYPECLRGAINGIINNNGIMGIDLLPAFVGQIPKGRFDAINQPADLDAIAAKLMEIAEIAEKIEDYHLQAAKKLEEIIAA